MKPDIEYLNRQFKRFNDLCFAGKLPPVEIRLNQRVRSLGLTRWRRRPVPGKPDIWIEISVSLDLPEEEYIDTLLHEMIHYYIHVNNLRDTSAHGEIFRAEMNRIRNDYGLPVSISLKRGKVQETQLPTVQRYFCVSKDTAGKRFITVVAASRVLEVHRRLPRLWKLQEIRWYSGEHPALGLYPRCITPKLYRIDASRLDEIISRSVDITHLVK